VRGPRSDSGRIGLSAFRELRASRPYTALDRGAQLREAYVLAGQRSFNIQPRAARLIACSVPKQPQIDPRKVFNGVYLQATLRVQSHTTERESSSSTTTTTWGFRAKANGVPG
jgi:hypothetical protein